MSGGLTSLKEQSRILWNLGIDEIMNLIQALSRNAFSGPPEPKAYFRPADGPRRARAAPEPVLELQPPGELTPDAGRSAGGELVRRIQAGEPRAETELVTQYREGLFFLLKRWTRDPETAEDLCQETLRLALEKIRKGEVREPDRLAAYLRSLAKNLSTQLYRRTGERTDLREELAPGQELPDRQPGALASLLQEEKACLARRVLQNLGSDRDRQILLRYYLSEERPERICSDLGLTSEHFYRVLHRARQRYRRLFEEQIDPALRRKD
jgi:RNA polymerase sigma-70 factor (ECF subfamily)